MLVVSEDEPSAPFTLSCFDKFNNFTAPERGDKWSLVAEPGGALRSFTAVKPNPDGCFTVEGLKPKEGEIGLKKQILLLKVKRKDCDELVLKWELDLNITASNRPHRVEV